MLKRNIFLQSVVLILCVFLLALGLKFYISPRQLIQVQANLLQECDREKLEDEEYLKCIEEKKKELEIKIQETQDQAQTLTNTINFTNNQIQLQQIQIAQTQAEIFLLEKELANLNERIDGLSLSLDRLTDILIVRVQASYKQDRVSSIISLFTTNTFSDFVTQFKYLQQAERQIARAMQEAESQRLLYDEQKNLKEIKQELLENKGEQLQAQQQQLENSRNEKERLLQQTKNDEATYQRLLAQAQAEINSFRAYTRALFGTAYCLDSPAPQPDGWFYSQRDPRWCDSRIGRSSSTIGAVGCLVASTAMIWQKHGFDATPLTIANNFNFFFHNTAYMLLPPDQPEPPGFTVRAHGGDLSIIDNELKNGRPVIVRLSVTFTSVQTHFIVLKSGSNGQYVMNDPLFQADMPFNSKYSVNQITSVRTFTPL